VLGDRRVDVDAGGAPRKQAGPRIAASRMSKLRQAAMTPINPMDLKLEQVSCALEGD
jgi:hypothetical protein